MSQLEILDAKQRSQNHVGPLEKQYHSSAFQINSLQVTSCKSTLIDEIKARG